MKTLNLDNKLLRENLRILRDSAGGQPLIGNLSCDACGLGLVPMAKLLWGEGVRFLAVDAARDALTLRREGLQEAEILLLHSTSDAQEIETLLDANGIATIGSTEAAMALNGLAERRATVAEAHIKIDTGAGLYGFLPTELTKMESVYRNLQNIAVSGVYTSLVPGVSGRLPAQQMELFGQALNAMRAKGLDTGLTHAADAPYILRRRDAPLFGSVRIDGAALAGRLGFRNPLQSTGCIASQVTEVMWLPKGSSLGTSGKLRRAARVGVIPVGYGDGFGLRRPVQGKRFVMWTRQPAVYVDGQKTQILGAIGLDYILVNLTKSGCAAGASVLLDVNPLFCNGLPKEYF